MSWYARKKLEHRNTYRARVAVMVTVGVSGVIAALSLYDLKRAFDGGIIALMAAGVYYLILEDMHVDDLHEAFDRKAMAEIQR